MAGQNNPKKNDGPKPVFRNDVVTPKGRVSFPHLAEPDSKGQYADNKYKVTLLLPKQGVDLAPLRKIVLEVAQEAFGPKIKTLKDFASPFRDGDSKALDGYEGHIYITAKSKNRPHVVDRAKAALDPKEVYGGCFARLVLTCGSYTSTENVKQADSTIKKETIQGVTFFLEAVQKISDGDAFGGKGNATAALPDDLGDDGFTEGDGPTGNGAHEGDESDMFR